MKKMKRIGAAILCLAVLLGLAGCKAQGETPTDTAETIAPSEAQGTQPEGTQPEETKEAPQAAGTFDQDLFGRWFTVEAVNNEAEVFSKYKIGNVCFLPDGTYAEEAWHGSTDSFTGVAKLTTEGNRILGLLEYWAQSMDAEEYAELPQWTVTYELGDIQRSLLEGNTTTEAFFKKYDKDKLTLHVVGTWKVTPVETKKIDSVLTFEKDYPVFDDFQSAFVDGCLLGEWKDTAGNTWSFSYASQDAKELTFSLTAENGKVYEGKKIYSHADYEEACEYFDFTFDGFKMEDLLFVSYDGTRFVFDNGGEEFALTRIA